MDDSSVLTAMTSLDSLTLDDASIAPSIATTDEGAGLGLGDGGLGEGGSDEAESMLMSRMAVNKKSVQRKTMVKQLADESNATRRGETR